MEPQDLLGLCLWGPSLPVLEGKGEVTGAVASLRDLPWGLWRGPLLGMRLHATLTLLCSLGF